MISPKIQKDDELRVKALKAYRIAETEAETSYNELAMLAKQICDTDVALISFIDKDMQWFKAHPGTELDRNTREYALCSHCINIPDQMMYVPDMTHDPILKHNPMVTGETHVRFYAGYPLLSHEGYAIGSVCVMHTEPKTLNQDQKRALLILRNQIMRLLELRRNNFELIENEQEISALNERLNEFTGAVGHDLKGPISNMHSMVQLIKEDLKKSVSETTDKYLTYLDASTTKINGIISNLLTLYRNDAGPGQLEAFDLKAHIEDLVELTRGTIPVSFQMPETGALQLNRPAITRIFSNLISNSIKFRKGEEAQINVDFKEHDDRYEIVFSDVGIGIAAGESENIFEQYYTLDSSSRGIGIGLSAVQNLVAELGGSIKVESTEGEGTSFMISLPKANK